VVPSVCISVSPPPARRLNRVNSTLLEYVLPHKTCKTSEPIHCNDVT
jgi:hypothetical protein